MLEQLSDKKRGELESLLLAFDLDWTPSAFADRLSELSAADEDYRRAALVELVKLDLVHRWKSGDPRAVDDYLQQAPELRDNPDVEAELLLAEYEARHAGGSPVSLDSRFSISGR